MIISRNRSESSISAFGIKFTSYVDWSFLQMIPRSMFVFIVSRRNVKTSQIYAHTIKVYV